MAKESGKWKKGRGKLGIFDPLIGKWEATGSSPMGPVTCIREFANVLGGKYLELNACWKFGQGNYEELAVIGVDKEGEVAFWSFTSDGKNSFGKLTNVIDIHPEAIGFEAQMPAGLARMIYWPHDEIGFKWAVEAKTKKGWRRFTEHHYKPA